MQASDLHKVGGFIQNAEQAMSAVTPALMPPEKQELPDDEAVRSDFKRGFAWKANGVYKDAQCISTGPMLHVDKADKVLSRSSLSLLMFPCAHLSTIDLRVFVIVTVDRIGCGYCDSNV